MATQPFPPGWDVRKNQDVPCFGNHFGGFRNPVTGVTRKARNRQTTSPSGASLLTYISANLRESGTGSGPGVRKSPLPQATVSDFQHLTIALGSGELDPVT